MDREEFLRSMQISDKEIIYAFESLMAMYSICSTTGQYKNININTDTDIISFDITYEEHKDAEQIYEISNGLMLKLYGKQYHISSSMTDECGVHIDLN